MLKITGEYSGNCRFGGLAIYQGEREDMLFCSNRSLWNKEIINVTGHQQTITSKSNNLTIVLFATTNYTSVSVSLNITTSDCQGVSLNPCEYTIHCFGEGHDHKVCQAYMNNISSSKIQFYIHKSKMNPMYSFVYNLVGMKQMDETCVQLFLSFAVMPRSRDIFHKEHPYKLTQYGCSLSFTPHQTRSSKHGILATWVGNVQDISCKMSVIGNILTNKYVPQQREYDEKFQTSKTIDQEHLSPTVWFKGNVIFKVSFQLFIFKSQPRPTYFDSKFKEYTISTIISTFLKFSFENLKQRELLSTWDIYNIISVNFILPLHSHNLNNEVQDKKVNLLFKFNSILYGKVLHIELKNLTANDNKNIVIGKLSILSTFCIFNRHCFHLAFFPFILSRRCSAGKLIVNRGTLRRKIFGHNCSDESSLTWKKVLKLSHLRDKNEFKVLLQGIYERVHFYLTDLPELHLKNQQAYLKLSWNDKHILENVNISLSKNCRKYYIFPEKILKRNVYSWDEAENFCIQHGSHLPSFSGESDIDDLVNTLIRAAWTGPIRMIYIGLKVSKKCMF